MFVSQLAFLSLAFAPMDGAHGAAPALTAAIGVEARATSGADSTPPAGTAPAAPTPATSAPETPVSAIATPPAPVAPVSVAAPAPDGNAAPVASPPAASAEAVVAPVPAAGTDASPDTAAPSPPRDPFEHFNRISYAISQPIDRLILRPAAMVYKAVVPHILRDGARNFLANLFTPVIFVNDVLQLRPRRTMHTFTRFLLNTSLGIGGVFDVAKRPPFAIKAHPNGFADTLGYYGMRAGPYIYLPVIGPANPRDMAGYFADWFTQPRLLNRMLNPDKDRPMVRSNLVVGQNNMVTMIVGGLDQRAQNDDALKALKAQAVDPYASLRSSYLQSREGEIAALKAPDGTAPANAALDDPLRDPAESVPPGSPMGAPTPR